MFDNVRGYKLPDKDIYIGYNYFDSNYSLPNVTDLEDNKIYVRLEMGKERMFTYYDNTTGLVPSVFRFYNRTIEHNLMGNYTVRVWLGDDNWLGSREALYTFKFIVRYAPNATIIPAPADPSSMGASVADLGLTGKVKLAFKVPMFINPKYVRSA